MLKQILHPLWTLLWQVWLIRNDDLHRRDKEEKKHKRLAKQRPRILALYSTKDRLLACDKPILDLPLPDRLKLHSRELETWIRLVTPTIKRALADADQYIRAINYAITDFLAPACPDPLTVSQHVNELRPIPRLLP